MGDIADGMINGDFDFETGEYLGDGGGFPRTRNGSLNWKNDMGNYGNPNPYNIVMNFLLNDRKLDQETAMEFVGDFTLKIPKKDRFNYIRNNWNDFKKIVDKNIELMKNLK